MYHFGEKSGGLHLHDAVQQAVTTEIGVSATILHGVAVYA